MSASGEKINKKKSKQKKINEKKILPKKTYLRPKEWVLTHDLGLEMVEVGASWVGLVKESTKEKKINQNQTK